jgi:hypothetical protein
MLTIWRYVARAHNKPPWERGLKMKVTVEVDCTPSEARAFLGLPDVTPLNERLVQEMQNRFDANVAMMQPEELMKSWMAFGGQAQEQFFKLMSAAAAAGRGGTGKG